VGPHHHTNHLIIKNCHYNNHRQGTVSTVLIQYKPAGESGYGWIPVVRCRRTSVADPDPGSGAFLPPGSGIRDGAMVGSGSGISKQNLLIAFIQK
jgi:hypothetical protein